MTAIAIIVTGARRAKLVAQPVLDISAALEQLPVDSKYFRERVQKLAEKLLYAEASRAIATLGQYSERAERLITRMRKSEEFLQHTNVMPKGEIELRESLITRRTAELSEALETAQENALARGTLLAHASHELRTPLNGIIGTTELLLAKLRADDPIAKDLGVVMNCAEDMQRVVTDLLTMGELRANRFKLTDEPFDLTGLLEQVCRVVDPAAAVKGLMLRRNNELDGQPWRRGDGFRIRQILLNLLSNAVKFSSAGPIDIEVREIDARIVEFSVCDTGIGIPEHEFQAVFEPFYQVDSSYHRQAGGAGLGLAISREIACRMEGDISLESRPGRGSRFTVRVALSRCAAPNRGGDSAGQNHEHLSAQKGHLRALRTLIVDDSQINAQILAAQLEALGVSGVEVVENALDAVERIRARPFDVVFMDCQMPVMDGYECATLIRKFQLSQQLRIIAVTAHAQSSDRKRFLDAGVDDYLPKPIPLVQLQAKLDEIAVV